MTTFSRIIIAAAQHMAHNYDGINMSKVAKKN